MGAIEIQEFRRRLAEDLAYDTSRKAFHEQYEWLEAYFSEKFDKNGFEKFCITYNDFYWGIDELREIARGFASLDPVGNSKMNNVPSENIVQATYFLKYKCNLYKNIEVDSVAAEIEEADKWNKSAFEALLLIIRQIRNNLFHGKKMELAESQYERNKILITLAASATKIILDNLISAESST